MQKKIAVIYGDGIGPDVVKEGMRILDTISQYSDYKFEYIEAPAGGKVYLETGSSLPKESVEKMKKCDAMLFGAIGLPNLPPGVAEQAILGIRQGFDQYVNLRPAKLFKPLYDACPLKDEFIGKGIDITIVRENTESIYTKIGGTVNDEAAVNSMVYTRKGVERIVKYAFEYAKRKGHKTVINVDKANILACSQFWRKIFNEIGDHHPDIEKSHFYVDAFCQWLIRKPYTVETAVTENMFGDIVSDETAYLIGSLGMAASGNINPNGISMYEPIHGSAPDIAGKGIANPIGTILSVKLMMEESFHEPIIGAMVEQAVESALYEVRTPDIYPQDPNKAKSLKKLGTIEMGTYISEKLKALMKK